MGFGLLNAVRVDEPLLIKKKMKKKTTTQKCFGTRVFFPRILCDVFLKNLSLFPHLCFLCIMTPF